MAFRFSEDGPAFPEELLDQLMAGDVVFLCGAGVSFPQLPGFKGLVEQVFAAVDVDMESGEEDAFNGERYEEVLGSLARRLVHQNKMYEAVETLLLPPDVPDLANHRTLLRLSRNLDNEICLVTTNFDTLFERAIAERDGKDIASKCSVAGQALPAPGGDDFSGVIHLHGRHPDQAVGLERTPVVLTSAEYGDAYMRSGWASRFLFDLARCKTIVLVGYRAGDAPVRYFLNILEADRERFPDLRPVYTFDGVDAGADEADARWSTLAVHPITYQKQADNPQPHGALWRDLGHLAELVERPKPRRRELAEAILTQQFSRASADDLDRLSWLLKGRGDLWDIIITKVSDPAWFDHFSERELWTKTDPDSILPSWFKHHWTEISALHAASKWCGGERIELIKRTDAQLHIQARPPSPWYQAWNLLLTSNLHRLSLHRGDAYHFAMRLQVDPPTDLDLRRAVDFLTPVIAIRPPFRFETENDEAAEPSRLRDFYSISLTARDSGAQEILDRLRPMEEHHQRLADLANEAIRSSIYLARDTELIADGWDWVESGIPSIAPDDQNDFHDGVIYLVGLVTEIYRRFAASDPPVARSIAERWRALPSELGLRLWLYAMTMNSVFAIDEVVEAIAGLPSNTFWARRPELFRLFEARFAQASVAQIDRIATRIISEGPTQFEDLAPTLRGETDWRPIARDHAMWTRLVAIDGANPLTGTARAFFDELAHRTPHLNRTLEKADLFSVYSSGVHSVTGNPGPLLEAAPEERLDLAHEYRGSHDFDRHANWRAYSSADPAGALETLSRNGFRPADTDLWRDLINALIFPAPAEEGKLLERNALFKKIFQVLGTAQDQDLTTLLHGLADAIKARVSIPARAYSQWWDRLWRLAVEAEAVNERAPDRFYDLVINTSSGKLAEALLRTIEIEKKNSGRVGRATMARLRRIVTEPSFAGQLAMGVCAQSIGFLVYIDEGFVRRYILPRLSADTEEAATLRSVVAEWGSLGVVASRLLKPILLTAAKELRSGSGNAQQVAAKILMPIVGPLATGKGEDWGFQASETRRALRSGSTALRVAAAQVLATWQKGGLKLDAEEAWRRVIGPTFERVWPQERRQKDRQVTATLARLASETGAEFPAAFATIKSYLSVLDGDGASVFFLYESDLPTTFPEVTLDLLWCLLRKRTVAYGSPELAASLDAIKAAKPELEIDRRFQWLEASALRFA